ncbi:MAG: alpha-L-fucosidase [Planctomycetota bacterium]|jgi:alpha-L-fucosidase
MSDVPSYLADYADIYDNDPRAAALEWFRNAKYGLFLHCGLYSILGKHEWVQLRDKIPVAEYAKLADRFTASGFDASAIADFAVDCGMKYVNLTTRHHDSFCLFDTKETDFKSTNSAAGRIAPDQRRTVTGPAGRDLVEACRARGLGLLLYYSHGRDWRHPHAANNDEWGGSARPKYDPPEPSYAYGGEHDLNKYLDFMSAQIRELLTSYGPLAAIWLDGQAVPRSRTREDLAKWRIQELYGMIHSLQPQVLVSYKQGVLGTEDFFTPEHKVPDRANERQSGKFYSHEDTPIQINTTMTPGSWCWLDDPAAERKTADDIWQALGVARKAGANLCLNTGPRPDGSLEPLDEAPMREVGKRIRAEGFPGA